MRVKTKQRKKKPYQCLKLEFQTSKTFKYSIHLPDCLTLAQNTKEVKQELLTWLFVYIREYVCVSM